MNRPTPNNKKPKKKSTLRVVAEILVVLILVEFYAYRKLATMEYEQMKDVYNNNANNNANNNDNEIANNNPQETRPLNPQEDRKKRRREQREQRQKHGRRKELIEQKKLERATNKKATQQFNLTHDIKDADAEERLKTANKLKHMGISGDIKLSELPPWSQIVENFNS